MIFFIFFFFFFNLQNRWVCEWQKTPFAQKVWETKALGPGFDPRKGTSNFVTNPCFMGEFRFFGPKKGDFVLKDFPKFDFFTSKIGFQSLLTNSPARWEFRKRWQHSDFRFSPSSNLALIWGPRFKTTQKSTKVFFKACFYSLCQKNVSFLLYPFF